MADKTTSRETLAKVASLVKPALASQSYIPALTHIRFDGEYATTYNDVASISVAASVDINRCVPGDLLIKAIGSFGGESVLMQMKDSALHISSGRSKIKLPTLPYSDFPLKVPPADEADGEIPLGADILKGIERCLISVGNDTAHPQQMGVTLDKEGGFAVLYSTDNYSLSRYQTKTKIKLPGDAPIILPTFFCEQMVSLSRTYPDHQISLLIHAGALVAEFGGGDDKVDAILFTKTLVDLVPRDFGKAIIKAIGKPDTVKNLLEPIPDAFDAAFARALLVLSSEHDKSTEVTFDGETMRVHSASSMGDSDDEMPFDQEPSKVAGFVIDPALVIRASKSCSMIACYPNALVLADKDVSFIHLISHLAS